MADDAAGSTRAGPCAIVADRCDTPSSPLDSGVELDEAERDVFVAVALAFPHVRGLVARILDTRARVARTRWGDEIFNEACRATARHHSRLDDVLKARVALARRRSARAGITMLACAEPAYPPLLLRLPDPPVVLWTSGRLAALATPAVAIVGARAASPAALATARRLGRDLAASGLTVVSGLARGVDGAAHRGALETGTTIAVLGTGVDVTYPPEHRDLADTVARRGLLLSEFAPGTPPRRRHFPLRNRLVAGLSGGVVIVEAGETSGALITAREALDQGKEVMVVPGQALGGRNRGGHALVKDGAALVEDATDVVAVLHSAGAFRSISATLSGGASPPEVASTEAPGERQGPAMTVPDAAWRAGEELDLDMLQGLTGLDSAALLSRLLEWELGGHVAATPGGRFVRLSR
jgi:DNA processing protein